MKKLLRKTLFLLFFLLQLSSLKLLAHSLTLSSTTYENKIVVQQCESYNSCYWIGGGWSRIDWYVNDVYYGYDECPGMALGYQTISITNKNIDCSNLDPGSTVKITAKIYHHDAYSFGYWADDLIQYQTLKSYTNVTNVQATDGLYMTKIAVTWNKNELFQNHRYQVQSNSQNVGAQLGAGTTSYTQTGVAPGTTNNYRVISYIGYGSYTQTSGTDQGSTFNLNLQASNNQYNNVVITWNNFGSTYHAAGFYLDWFNDVSGQFEPLYDRNDNVYTSYTDNGSVHQLIPGFTYQYRLRVKPITESDVVGIVSGKTKPNGNITGNVRTPSTGTNPNGVGVPNVQIIATLQGSALPTDTTTVYTTYTDANGHYEIHNVYYYQSATFKVIPVLSGRTFNPAERNVTLELSNPSATADFTDMSSFVVSGTIMQGNCPIEGVSLLLDGDSTNVETNANGEYNITIANGGNYTIKPVLENHLFNPVSTQVSVTSNTSGVNFEDTTSYVVEGHFTASCNAYIGIAKLRFYSDENGLCFSDTVLTNSSGYYSVALPARKLKIGVIDFTSVDEQLINSVTVQAFFSAGDSIDLTHYDSTAFYHDTTSKNFVYRQAPHLNMTGLNAHNTCSGEILPLLQQHAEILIAFDPIESFNGSMCPAEDGYIIINENISSDGVVVNSDTIIYHKGDTILYSLTPGYPNIIAPHKKFIQAIFVSGSQSDTTYADVIVVGNKPRSQTFTTTTPQMPFHVLHNPPGDASYSYLAQNTSISNSFTTSFLQEGSVDTYVRAQLGQSYSVELGFIAGVSTEVSTQFDVTGSFGLGSGGLTEDASTITTTTTEQFQTSGNVNITGGAGDVYIGGALNMLYAVSDVLQYDFNNCELEQSTTLMMQPVGIATTFMYTEDHIVNVVIPELQSIADHYYSINQPDSASFFLNQLGVWQQVVDQNHQNIDDADFIENKTFSGGVLYENTVETTRSTSHSFDFNFYLDYGVAVDIGASVAGIGLYGGVAVEGRSTWGSVVANETSNTTTVGYVLSDDDLGDSYTVDIKNDKAYGVPAFKLVAGRSSCPWEPGTLPREGVQLSANTYSQSVEQSQQAVYTLQLSNTSQSNETMTYDLVFDHTSNPNGAVITIGGSPVVGGVPYPYTIPAGQSVNVTVTVSKGPSAKVYNGLKFTLKSSCDDQISQDIYLNAYFYNNYNLTVVVSGSGTTSIPAGVHPYQENSSVILYASPAQGYEFQKWVVGTTEYLTQAIQIAMDTNKTATAYFIPSTAPQFSLQISNVGNGTSIPPAGTYYYNQGTPVNLTAYPAVNNAFVNWEINGTIITNYDTTITINQNTTAIAHFVPTHTLSVDIVEGSGTTTPTAGVHVIHEGDLIHLYASPAPGYIFQKWIINTTEYNTQNVDITMTADVEAHAYFAPTSSPQDTVTISVVGGGTTNPPAGQHYFVHGSTISLTAYPNQGMLFQKWIINSIETSNNPVNMTITGDITVEAVFIVDSTTYAPENHLSGNVVSIYPNPATDVVNIKSDNVINHITFIDITGKVVFDKKNINSKIFEMNLDQLKPGMYFIKINSEFESSVFKLQIIN